MSSMNFPDPNVTPEYKGWVWDGDKWVKDCPASGGGYDDTQIIADLNQEVADREAGDLALQGQIDALGSGGGGAWEVLSTIDLAGASKVAIPVPPDFTVFKIIWKSLLASEDINQFQMRFLVDGSRGTGDYESNAYIGIDSTNPIHGPQSDPVGSKPNQYIECGGFKSSEFVRRQGHYGFQDVFLPDPSYPSGEIGKATVFSQMIVNKAGKTFQHSGSYQMGEAPNMETISDIEFTPVNKSGGGQPVYRFGTVVMLGLKEA